MLVHALPAHALRSCSISSFRRRLPSVLKHRHTARLADYSLRTKGSLARREIKG